MAARKTSFTLTPAVLRKTAGYMTPFYRKIAGNRAFAAKWAAAVRRLDLGAMERLFRSAVPPVKIDGLATNGIGYFIDFAFPKPIELYSNGTTIPPGTARFTFSAPIHRKIATAVIPFYQTLACSAGYAAAIAKAIRTGDSSSLGLLVRLYVKSSALRKVEADFDGIRLVFKFKSAKHTYVNMLFREISD